jgi:hypothetical protein
MGAISIYTRCLAVPALLVIMCEGLHALSRFVVRRNSSVFEGFIENMMLLFDGVALFSLLLVPFLLIALALWEMKAKAKRRAHLIWLPVATIGPFCLHAWRYVEQVGPSWLSWVKGKHFESWYFWGMRPLSFLSLAVGFTMVPFLSIWIWRLIRIPNTERDETVMLSCYWVYVATAFFVAVGLCGGEGWPFLYSWNPVGD